MENYNRGLKAKGVDMYSDSSAATRLSQRPSQKKGSAYEDFGSDFGGGASSRPSQPTRNHLPSKPSALGKKDDVIVLGDFSGSDDELDFLSGSSRHGSSSPAKPKPKAKRKVPERRRSPSPLPIVIDSHQRDPGYKPHDFKKMKIPKKSSAATSGTSTPNVSQDAKPCVAGPSSAASSNRKRDIAAVLEETAREEARKDRAKREVDRAKQRVKGNHPLRERSPNQDRTTAPKSYAPPWDNSDEEDKDVEKTPRPSRPVPRPVNKGANSRVGKSQTVADMQPSASQDREKGKQKEPVFRSRTLQTLDSLTISDDEDSYPKPTASKGKAREQGAAKSGLAHNATAVKKATVKGKEREHDPISAIFEDEPPRSPVQPARKKPQSDFPMPSPLSSPAAGRASSPRRKSQLKGHRVVVSSDEEGSESGARSLRPFPMETHFLESLKRVSPAKRSIVGDNAEVGGGPSRKRPRRSSPDPDKTADSFALDLSDPDSDLDNMFLDPSVDPKTLCPWCDERLPSHPTPHLLSLIAGARRRSYADDRPANPLGLRAPPTVFVGVCQRHRFERVWIPRARRRGWPTHIDWGALRGRIERLRGVLQAIVDDVDEDFAPGAAARGDGKGEGKGGGSGEGKERRARKENEFWQEVVRNVREQGSRQTTGVRGQFLHFNKTQPGYYGELGYVIIHQTLCDLFPPAAFDPAAARPLTPADFLAHVLVPEAAVHLIAEDLALSRAEAIATLRESVEYGVAMFPADEGEGGGGGGEGGRSDVLSAGERIIMERARARRKELEEEERREEEEDRRALEGARRSDTEPDMELDSDTAPPSSSSSTKPKPRAAAKSKPLSSEKPKPPSSEKPKPKPRAASRARSLSKAPDSDGGGVIDLSSDTGHSTDASRSAAAKRRRKAPEEPTSTTEKSDAPSDAAGATPRPKPKPKPRPRAIVRAGLAAAVSQPDVRSTRREDVADLRAPASDPPAPLHDDDDPVQFMYEHRKPTGQVRKSQTEGAVDATPRPKPRPLGASATKTGEASSSSDASGKKPPSDASQMCPLQMAKERRQERATSSKPQATVHTNGWLPNLRAIGEDESSSDDEVVEVQRGEPPNTTAAAPRRTLSGSDKKDESHWSWLLSDGSSAGSRTSSLANFD